MQGAGQPEQRSDAECVVAQPGSQKSVVGGVVADGQIDGGGENGVGVGADDQSRARLGAGQPGVDVVQVVELNLVAQTLQVSSHPPGPFGFAAGRCWDLLDGDGEVDNLLGDVRMGAHRCSSRAAAWQNAVSSPEHFGRAG